MVQSSNPEVFTAREVARAAGVSELEVQALIEAGAIAVVRTASGRAFVPHAEALRAGIRLSSGRPFVAESGTPRSSELFREHSTAATARAPFAVSGILHGAAIALIVLLTTLGLGRTVETVTEERLDRSMRLVYLAVPGPGGGGGGGGLRAPAPPPKAERKGKRSLSSPLPVRERPPQPKPFEQPREPDPKPIEPEPLPPVEAPVVAAPSDERERAGVLEETPPRADSRGPGSEGGVGTGAGTGIGEGEGSGIGEGSGGGTGGGPYRPGSGIQPPTLLREVKPDYSEPARRQGIEGDVVMEIVVRRDGSVGDVRVLQGLGHGLDERAVQAVRQWRFNPARRHGAPVDVLVEVAMEFKLR